MHEEFTRKKRLFGFTPAEGGQSPLLCGDKVTQYSPCLIKKGFTLAEVLVALGIIGVVAAMTLPTLIKDYQKSVIEARLKWFYSTINQAVRMSVVDNGEAEYWISDVLGQNTHGIYENNEKWFNKYLSPYLKHEEVFDCTNVNDGSYPYMCVRMTNNTLFAFNIDVNGLDVNFYPFGKPVPLAERNIKNTFKFQFHKRTEFEGSMDTKSINYIEPYTFKWNKNVDTLKTGHTWSCYDGNGVFCTKLLQLNNWKFPDDYPW